tara:strand:+ start:745 stop:1722 length:978 start_codon:yes stop_codon:yes gene_type:complete
LKTKRLLLIDQLNLFFRSYIVDPSLSTNGQPIGGLKGVIKSLQKIIRESKPDQVIICWDGQGGSARRKIINKNYKEGRKPPRLNRGPRVLTEAEETTNKVWQLQRLTEYFNEMPLVQFMFSGVEADDVIAYLSKHKYYEDWQKVIVSSDKDFFQLLDQKTVLYRPVQKQVLNMNNLIEKHKIHPNNFALARAMAGDKSDNLEGVGNIGLATAYKRFPFLSESRSITLTEVLEYSKEQLQEKKLKAYENIVNNADVLKRNYKIMQLYTPILDINAKKVIHETIQEAELGFNKTELIKMMTQDGFGEINFNELFVHFNKIVVDNKPL